MLISIHKALTGLDGKKRSESLRIFLFQSTRPSRASTTGETVHRSAESISIHKALTGLDGGNVPSSTIKDISIHKALTGLDNVALRFPI